VPSLTQEQKDHLVGVIDETVEKLQLAGRRGRKSRDLSPFAGRLARDLRSAWKELATDFAKEWNDPAIGHTFEAKRNGPTNAQVDALFNRVRGDSDESIEVSLTTEGKRSLEKGAKSAQLDLDSATWKVKSEDAIKWAEKNAAKQVKAISENSRKRIKRLVLEMLEQGKSQSEIAAAINDLIDSWSAPGVLSRGELIANTETGQAYEQGRLMIKKQFEKAGLKVEKSWLASAGNVCPVCEAAESDGWISSNETFSNGLDAPLAHPGCACDLQLQVVV
jgi:hypothetical protein